MLFLIKMIIWLFIAAAIVGAFNKINEKLDNLNITVDQIKSQLSNDY